jgi:hypothetical protein
MSHLVGVHFTDPSLLSFYKNVNVILLAGAIYGAVALLTLVQALRIGHWSDKSWLIVFKSPFNIRNKGTFNLDRTPSTIRSHC